MADFDRCYDSLPRGDADSAASIVFFEWNVTLDVAHWRLTLLVSIGIAGVSHRADRMSDIIARFTPADERYYRS